MKSIFLIGLCSNSYM